VFTWPHHWSPSSAASIRSIHPILSLQIHCNISLQPKTRPPQWLISFWPSQQNTISIPLTSHACYMPCPSHPHWLIVLHNKYKQWATLLCSFLKLIISNLFRSNNSPWQPVLKHLMLCSSPKVTREYKTAGTIIVLYILIFKLFEIR
jgi:hypothetical protein